jgi:hypothetical protein
MIVTRKVSIAPDQPELRVDLTFEDADGKVRPTAVRDLTGTWVLCGPEGAADALIPYQIRALYPQVNADHSDPHDLTIDHFQVALSRVSSVAAPSELDALLDYYDLHENYPRHVDHFYAPVSTVPPQADIMGWIKELDSYGCGKGVGNTDTATAVRITDLRVALQRCGVYEIPLRNPYQLNVRDYYRKDRAAEGLGLDKVWRSKRGWFTSHEILRPARISKQGDTAKEFVEQVQKLYPEKKRYKGNGKPTTLH